MGLHIPLNEDERIVFLADQLEEVDHRDSNCVIKINHAEALSLAMKLVAYDQFANTIEALLVAKMGMIVSYLDDELVQLTFVIRP